MLNLYYYKNFINEIKNTQKQTISPEKFDQLYDTLKNFNLEFFTDNIEKYIDYHNIDLSELNSEQGKERFNSKQRGVANYIYYKLSQIFDTSTTELGNKISHSKNISIQDEILCTKNEMLITIRIPEKTVMKFSEEEKKALSLNKNQIKENLSIPVFFKINFKENLYEKYNKSFENDFNIKEGQKIVYKYPKNEYISFYFKHWKIDHIEVIEKTYENYEDDETTEKYSHSYYDENVFPKANQIFEELRFYENDILRIQ